MRRTAATAVHLTLSILAGVGYFLFIIPRWWELMGDTSHTLGTVIRIATGVLAALAALPVLLTLLRTRQPELRTPVLASKLRLASAIAHVVSGVLIVAAAIAEIWLTSSGAGPWLYGVYGGALALAILGGAGFYLSFVAEKPPAPPRPAKPKKVKKAKKVKTEETPVEPEAAEPETTETESPEPESPEPESPEPEATEPEVTETEATEVVSTGGLQNKRPTGKVRHRLPRSARGAVATDD